MLTDGAKSCGHVTLQLLPYKCFTLTLNEQINEICFLPTTRNRFERNMWISPSKVYGALNKLNLESFSSVNQLNLEII